MWKKVDKTLDKFDGKKYLYAYNSNLKTLLIKTPYELPAEMYLGIQIKDLKTAKKIVQLIEE